MFGHLKNEEFMEIVESDCASAQQKAHLDSCLECASTLKSTASVYSGFCALEADIVEPDWEEFRLSVRNGLLSRSIQRQSVVRRWTGWPLRSSLAVAFSFLIVVGLLTGGVLWHLERDGVNRAALSKASTSPAIPIESPAQDTATTDLASWSHEDPFEELSEVDDSQAPQLRKLIQSALAAQGGTLQRQ